MMFSFLLIVIAIVVAVPAITGKGRMLNTEYIKKDKVTSYKKWMRLIYGLMALVALTMAFFNFVEKEAYTQTHYYEFTESYVGKDGVTYPAGEKHSVPEMLEIIKDEDKPASNSLCAPVDTEALPYRYVETTYTLQEKYQNSFLKAISYKRARILNYVMLGVSMAVIFTLFLFMNLMTDKKAQKKAREQANSPVRPSMPKGAFDFSDYKDEVEVTPDKFSEPTEEPAAESAPVRKKKK